MTKTKNFETENAEITHTFLGYSHGVFTFNLTLKLRAGSIAYGNYCLDNYDEDKDCRIGTAFGCSSITKILDTVGVNSWEKLVGNYIRINKVGYDSQLTTIGHIVEDKWMNLNDLQSEFEKEFS